MTRLDAFRALLAAPRDHPHQGKIGRRVLWAKADGRERIVFVARVLRSVLRRAS